MYNCLESSISDLHYCEWCLFFSIDSSSNFVSFFFSKQPPTLFFGGGGFSAVKFTNLKNILNELTKIETNWFCFNSYTASDKCLMIIFNIIFYFYIITSCFNICSFPSSAFTNASHPFEQGANLLDTFGIFLGMFFGIIFMWHIQSKQRKFVKGKEM